MKCGSQQIHEDELTQKDHLKKIDFENEWVPLFARFICKKSIHFVTFFSLKVG